jgi:hypothetical protein
MIYKRGFLGIPIAPRRNRRWLVAAYWLVIVSFTCGAFALLKAHPQRSTGINILFTYAFMFAAIGLGRMVWDTSFTPQNASAGIRTLFDSALEGRRTKAAPRDEREQRQWDKAHTTAYALLSLVVILAFPLQLWKYLPDPGQLREPLILLVTLVIINLPQSVLLWTEPDMETPNES